MSTRVQVSPKYYRRSDRIYGPNTDEEVGTWLKDVDLMVDVYEDQLSGWLFQPANLLRSGRASNAGFALLTLALSYIEGNQQFRDGRRSDENHMGDGSTGAFTRACTRIFPAKEITKEGWADFFDKARCGAFHWTLPKPGTLINHEAPTAVAIERGAFEVNPERLLDAVEVDFKAYVELLRSGSEQDRKLFLAFWRELEEERPISNAFADCVPPGSGSAG